MKKNTTSILVLKLPIRMSDLALASKSFVTTEIEKTYNSH